MKGEPMNTVVRAIIGGIVGAAIGYALYRFVGCRTGVCPLTSNPWVAMTIWGVMGVLLAIGK